MHLLFYAIASLEYAGKPRRLQYSKKKDVIWQMFEKDPGVFNEESGESSLSFLSRHIASQPSRYHNFQSANQSFQRLGLFISHINDTKEKTYRRYVTSDDVSLG